MKKKELAGIISLQVSAHQANPSPPIGPAFGQRGLNIMEFCKQFNDLCKKKGYEPGDKIPVVVSYYGDKSFTMETKNPPVPNLIKKLGKIKSGAKTPGTQVVGSITMEIVNKIAAMKAQDMGGVSIKAAVKMVMGTCVSMGVKVEG